MIAAIKSRFLAELGGLDAAGQKVLDTALAELQQENPELFRPDAATSTPPAAGDGDPAASGGNQTREPVPSAEGGNSLGKVAAAANGIPVPSADGLNGTAEPPADDGLNGRDPATGKFVKGNKCGRGNPHFRRLARNRTLFLEAIGDDDLKALARQLHAEALAGDREAARLVLAYVIGRPVDAVT
jgi:hypothetical protein